MASGASDRGGANPDADSNTNGRGEGPGGASTPALLFITAADTELQTLAAARRRLPDDFPGVAAYHLRDLASGEAIGRLAREDVPGARVVVARILGGLPYFRDGFMALDAACRAHGVPLVALPGGRDLDPELTALSSAPVAALTRVLEYTIHGGVDNAEQLLRFLADHFALRAYGYEAPTRTPERGPYQPPDLPQVGPGAPRVGIAFYRAHWLSGDTGPIDALAAAIQRRGCRAVPVFCDSLRETDTEGVPRVLSACAPDLDVLVVTMAFSAPHGLSCPVVQAILSESSPEAWAASAAGLGPRDVAMHVALPEFDGRIISVPTSFKAAGAADPALGAPPRHNRPLADRVEQVAELAVGWVRLRRKPNSDKRIALLFNNYPTRNSRIGNGVGLDTPESVVRILRGLQGEGYRVDRIPADGDALMGELLAGVTHDVEFQSPEQLEAAPHQRSDEDYRAGFAALPARRRRELERQWGEAPGHTMRSSRGLAIPGMALGHVFVGIQPARGYGVDSPAIYHSPDLPPTHFYLAYYQWLREDFAADAVIHVGKHGNLEWLPGKGIGLSADCYPELALGALPHLYPFIINDPGEGSQAKRRAHAVVVDHMVPPMTRAESYGDLIRLEQLADEYAQVSVLDPDKAPLVIEQMLPVIERSQIHRDLALEALPKPDEIEDFIQAFDGYLCEIKESQIRDGLHILGELPRGERLENLLVALLRIDQGGVLGLPAAIAADRGIDYAALLDDPSRPCDIPGCRSAGDGIEWLEAEALRVVRERRPVGSASAATLAFLEAEVEPRLVRIPEEIENLLAGLAGRFVPPGPSGAPTRGMATILPTGRNFYSVDVRAIPTPTACAVGRRLADALLERYRAESGGYPRSVGLVVWGTSTMRTGGDDLGEIFHLLGVRPVWEGINRRVVDLEIIPPEELGRPRIDVTVRISGFFRDGFAGAIHWLDEAVRRVAALDETPEQNYLRAHWERDCAAGADPERARWRIFGSKPGSYGAGLLNLIDERNWKTEHDLAEVYVNWGGYAYGRDAPGVPAFGDFRQRLAQVAVAAQNQDNREHDLFDSDDYFQFHGGMIATIRSLTGRNPTAYFGDSAKPERVRVRALREEVTRVLRSRVLNPKWIRGLRRHGYRGGSELAATVDYLFGYSATAQVVEPWMYEQVAAAYVFDPEVRAFLAEKNPWALRGVIERLLEAQERELWRDPLPATREALRRAYLESDTALEEEEEEE